MSLRNFLGLAASLVVIAAGVRAADPPDPATPDIRDVVRDDTGRIWGLGAQEYALCFLDANEHWRAAIPPEMQEMGSACLARRADGTVVCLWQSRGGNYRCSEHRGDFTRLLPAFTNDESRPGLRWRFLPDSKGGLWLTCDSACIYRLTPGGAAECVHRLSAEECLPGADRGPDTRTGWGHLALVEDAGGRIWFWTDHSDSMDNVGTIRGALIYEPRDGTFTQHDFLVPVSPAPRTLTVLARKDDAHFWFSPWGEGLWTLDTTTFQAERVPDQPREAALILGILHAECGATFIVGGGERPGEIGASILWRVTGGEKDATGAAAPLRWEKRVDGIDVHQASKGQADRLCVRAKDGEYIGSNGKGLWFVPCDGSAARLLDWQRGFPLQNPARLFDLQNGRWLALDRREHTWIGSPEALLADRPLADVPRVHIVHTDSRVMPDARGHLWSTFVNNGPSLREWDGERWIDHRFPDIVSSRSNLILLNYDGRGRIWLRGNAQKRRVAVYDPAADKWEVFDALDLALEAHGKDGQAAEFQEIESRGIGMPRYGPSGQITYLAEEARVSVAVFDGHAWRHWSEEEITGQPRYGYDGGSFFNGAGRPCININHQTWEQSTPTQWRVATYDPGADNWQDGLSEKQFHPPREDKIPFHPDSAARDNQGAWWLTWQHALYKAQDGWCVPVFAAGDASPFADGRRVTRACIDARGNAVLTAAGTVFIAPAGSVPTTTLAEESKPESRAAPAPDQKIVRLTTTAAPLDGKVRLRWRLDGGPWNALDADAPIAVLPLEGLAGGAHRLEARALDPALQTDLTPAAIAFTVQIADPPARIAGLVKQLDDPDFTRRNAAVAALANEARTALPALRAARENLPVDDNDRRWWIDAAIQGAEREAHRAH